MATPKVASDAPQRVELKGSWLESQVPLTFVDEIQIVEGEDRYYMIFAQVRIPSSAQPNISEALVSIEPVAHFVLTKPAADKIAQAMRRAFPDVK